MKVLFGILVSFLFIACGGSKDVTKVFDIAIEGEKNQFKKNEQIKVSIKNDSDLIIKEVAYFIDDKQLTVNSDQLILDVEKLGNKILKATINYDDTSIDITKKIKVLAENAPEIYTYEVLNTFPHDKTSFTQGLEFKNDILYESTGHRGESVLRKIDYKTGNILQEVRLDDSIFGEGLTVLNNKVYQLSWQSGLGFIYNKEDLKKIDTFNYGKSKEGWGLCNDGKKIYKSDGTEKIWILDPNTLIEENYIETVTNKSVFNKANELEFVNGKLYANVWQKESMMIIDATSGAIEGVVNFGGLKKQVTQHPKLDVLNGIAYHPTRKTFFVTGKNWDKIFEVHIIKK